MKKIMTPQGDIPRCSPPAMDHAGRNVVRDNKW